MRLDRHGVARMRVGRWLHYLVVDVFELAELLGLSLQSLAQAAQLRLDVLVARARRLQLGDDQLPLLLRLLQLRLALLRRAPRRLALLRQLVDRVAQLRLHRLDHLTNASANINVTF